MAANGALNTLILCYEICSTIVYRYPPTSQSLPQYYYILIFIKKEMAEKSKIVVIGGTGNIGKSIVEASVKAGHTSFVYIMETSFSDPVKKKLIQSFKNSGVTLFYGNLYDHGSLVKAIKHADVVISTVCDDHLDEQMNIIAAIKEAGNVKRFFPSEFEDEGIASENKASIRRAIVDQGIPFTYVCTGSPKDEYAKVVYNMEADIAAITIKAVDDPTTLNKILHVESGNTYSSNAHTTRHEFN